MFLSAFATSVFAKSGKLRAVAVTSPKRMEEFPNVPAVAETLPGFVEGGYQGIFARAGTPPEIINKLNAEVNNILKMPDARERLAGLGAEPHGSTPEAMRQFLKEDREHWARLIKELNFKLEQ